MKKLYSSSLKKRSVKSEKIPTTFLVFKIPSIRGDFLFLGIYNWMMEGSPRRLDIKGKINQGKDLITRSLSRLGSRRKTNPDFISETRGIEERIMGSASNRVLASEEFGDFIQRSGFAHFKRGTYQLADKSAFLYDKHAHIATSEEEARMKLRVLRHLTNLGVLYPATKWGIHQTQDHNFQMFAITRGLHTFHPDDPLYNQAPSISPDYSHVWEWFKRADPNLEVNNDLSLALLLNPNEALHLKNWGWDSSTGVLYPIDVEVIDFEDDEAVKVVRQWCLQNPE